MGSFDGAEVCELYLLDILRKDFGENKIGFYKDDELSCFRNLSGPESAKIGEKNLQDLQTAWVKYYRSM